MKLRWLAEWACRLLAGGIFVYAGLNKIGDLCGMASDIHQYQMVPGILINFLAILIPMSEIVFGVALILGIAPRGAAFGIIGMLMIFTIAISINFVRGIDMDCGCFGSDQDMCRAFSEWIAGHSTYISGLIKVRVRLGCDILRDIVFLAAASGAFFLLLKGSQSQ